MYKLKGFFYHAFTEKTIETKHLRTRSYENIAYFYAVNGSLNPSYYIHFRCLFRILLLCGIQKRRQLDGVYLYLITCVPFRYKGNSSVRLKLRDT